MASTATIGNLETVIRDIGRAAVFYSVGAFAGTGNDLTLVWLGDTEGDVTVDLAPEYSELTTPELTGPVAREKYIDGLKPTITIPLYKATQSLDAIINPAGVASGSQGGGMDLRKAVTEYALVIFPFELFIESDALAAVSYTTAGDWTVGGDAATAAQLALLDLAIFFWRGHFDPVAHAYQHADGGKSITEVTFHAMHNNAMQQQHYIFTQGRPDQAATAIEISAS